MEVRLLFGPQIREKIFSRLHRRNVNPSAYKRKYSRNRTPLADIFWISFPHRPICTEISVSAETFWKILSSLPFGDGRAVLTKKFINFSPHSPLRMRFAILRRILKFSFLISLPRKRVSFWRRDLKNLPLSLHHRGFEVRFGKICEQFFEKGQKISRSTLMALRQTAETL